MNESIILKIKFTQNKDFDESMVNAKTKTLSKAIDTNMDNQIDPSEFEEFYNDSISKMVDEEKQWLFDPCDLNKDESLNRTEVIKCCKQFLKSEVTAFGHNLLPNDGILKDEL
jgi:hypothetical protein